MRVLRQILDNSPFWLVFRYELTLLWRKGRLRHYLPILLCAVAAAISLLVAVPRWIPVMASYEIAAIAQPCGLGPSIPDVNLFTEIPLWAYSIGFITLSWVVFLLLLGARITLAAVVSASVVRDRNSSHAEMLSMSRVPPRTALLARVLAPVAPLAAIATFIFAIAVPQALSEGMSPWVVLRIWGEILLQYAAISAVSCAISSRVRRAYLAATLSQVAATVGVSLLLWICGWLELCVSSHHLALPAGANPGYEGFPYTLTRLQPLAWLCLLTVALLVSRPKPRPTGRQWLVAGTLGLFVIGNWALLPKNVISPLEVAGQRRIAGREVDCAVDDLARGNPTSALARTYAEMPTPVEEERAAAVRACALIELGRFEEASTACERLRVMRLSIWALTDIEAGLDLTCLAAGDRPRRVRIERRAYRFLVLVLNQPAGRPVEDVRRDEAAFVWQEIRALHPIEPDYYIPDRAILLRWAVRRYPRRAGFRRELADELDRWQRQTTDPAARQALSTELQRLTGPKTALLP